MSEQRCPNCGGPMWDNRQNKKNPKAPDYKCKSKDCIDPETGYVTAIWLPKPKQAPKAPPRASNAQIQPNGEEHAKKEMLMSYCKDVVVAEISKGIEVKEPFKRITDGFKALMVAYAHPFGRPKPSTEIDIDEEQPAEDHEGVPF